ncbi:hypothetical protein BKA70DRAFT_1233332 [Coprinopsis sp. MPI-PUGE-AT-0042]|nr:hypothetical protein BKA70DRAFT_1233332 [Coprinopsis sp. MPI-PUGE-AT-0042]
MGDPTIGPEERGEAIVYEEAQSSYGRVAQPSDLRCFRKLKTRLDGNPNHTSREKRRVRSYGRETQPYNQRDIEIGGGRELRGIPRLVWTGSPTIRPEMDEEKEEERADSGNSESAADKSHQDADMALGPASASVFFHLSSTAWLDAPSKQRVSPHMNGNPNHTRFGGEDGYSQPYDQRNIGIGGGRELRGIPRLVWTGSPTIRPEMDEEKEEEGPIAATLNPRLTNPIKTPTRLGQRRPASFPSTLNGLVGRSVQASSVSSYERVSQSYKERWFDAGDGCPQPHRDLIDALGRRLSFFHLHLDGLVGHSVQASSVSSYERVSQSYKERWFDAGDGCRQDFDRPTLSSHLGGLVGPSVQTSRISEAGVLELALIAPRYLFKLKTWILIGQRPPRTSPKELDRPTPNAFSERPFPNMSQSVEARSGRAFLLDGKLMYSPNSQRVIRSPLPHRVNNMDVNPFQPDVRWEALLHPPRWTRAFGWVSFLPMSRHHFHTTPFHALSFFPQLKCKDGLFSLDEDTVKSWDELGANIRTVVLRLQNHFQAPLVPPYVPRGWGYYRQRRSERKARAITHASRDWFLVWMGALSFLIAYSKAPDTTQARSLAVIPYPNGSEPWQQYLHTFPDLVRFAQELATSSVVGYTPEAQRVGIVVDFVEKEDPYQPAVDWFFSFGIPVWYPWDTTANDFAVRHGLAHLIPPADMLQQCCPPFLHTPSAPLDQAPSSSDQPPAPSSSKPAPGPGSSDAASRAAQIATIIQGFEARVVKIRESWSTQDAEAAANRARQPPEVNVEVYEYTPDYETPGKLVREKIVKSSRRDTLGQYHENQCRYFPELNLWICCADLSPDDSVEDDEDEIYPQPLYDLPPPPPASSASAPSLSLTDLSPAGFADTYADDNGFSNLERDILLPMSRFLGYTPPLPYPTHNATTPLNATDGQALLRILGIHPEGSSQAGFFKTSMPGKCTPSFPGASRLDLIVIKAPVTTFTKSAKLESYWYLFNVGVGYDDRKTWKLALTTATRRSCSYEFNGDDYDAYLRLRNHMLKHPRMRAALLRGGIIWRLAVAYLFPEDAFWPMIHSRKLKCSYSAGPMCATLGMGTRSRSSPGGRFLKQFEQGEDLGRWTAVNEDWYQRRLAAIKAGTASPMNRKRWRDDLRGLKDQRVLRQQTEKKGSSLHRESGRLNRGLISGSSHW